MSDLVPLSSRDEALANAIAERVANLLRPVLGGLDENVFSVTDFMAKEFGPPKK